MHGRLRQNRSRRGATARSALSPVTWDVFRSCTGRLLADFRLTAPCGRSRMEPGMSAVDVGSAPGFFSRERIVAAPGFNRWLVPPAALAIHLCIGMAYGFSVFWLPLSRAVGITTSIACPKDFGLLDHRDRL
jgi:hypothetical protein